MRGPSWLQANLALPARHDAYSESMHSIFEDVFPVVESLKRRKLLRCFFFMRKPPGLRLRFALLAPREEAMVEIGACLHDLTRRRVIGKWFPSVYEPETFKFGGSESIEAVHAYFFADSTAWWRWKKLQFRAQTSMQSPLLSACALNDLFARFLDGPEEVWDVWCRVAALHGACVVREGQAATAPSRIEDLINRVTPEEQQIFRTYSSCNETLARRFREIHARGKLLYRNRLVLPHIGLYQWNRYGFAPEERSSIFTAMVCAWSPNR
jgi:thiopeptide-type bacteriocin biosynthesis protein